MAHQYRGAWHQGLEESLPLSPQNPTRYRNASIEYTGYVPEPLAGRHLGVEPQFERSAYAAASSEPVQPPRSPRASLRNPSLISRGRQNFSYQNLSDQDPWRMPSPVDGRTRLPHTQRPNSDAQRVYSTRNNFPLSNNASPANQPPNQPPPPNKALPLDGTEGQDNTALNNVSTFIPREPSAPVTEVDTSRMPYRVHENPYSRYADTLLNRMAGALRVKRTFHWLHHRHFHIEAFFSLHPAKPHSYQLPGYYYKSENGASFHEYKHKDVFGRKYEGWNEDMYLDPLNGRVRELFVQTVDDTYDKGNDTNWRRTYIRNVSPWIIRLAYWPYSRMPDAGSNEPYGQSRQGRFEARTGIWGWREWMQAGSFWLPACIGLLILMCGPTDIEGQVRNHGFYDPVPYRYYSYPKSARNIHENKEGSPRPISGRDDVRLKTRKLLPRFLCFPHCVNQTPRGCFTPLQWMESHGNGRQPRYIFISYTGERQFGRLCDVAKEERKKNPAFVCNCKKCNDSRSDADALHEIAQHATKAAGVDAYWTDQCCMSSELDEFSEDIYGIGDVVRGARMIVVVVGRTGAFSLPQDITTARLLREWGSRMWTWPEVLLGPIGEEVLVYIRGAEDWKTPLKYHKLDFASRVWPDHDVARQLIDNYENTLTLSRLELVILALECLARRVKHGTTKFAEGDLSYALMGLLRQRPKVEISDSAFQAFPRLSLANDSDRLLERMICLLPDDADSENTMSDSSHIEDEHTSAPDFVRSARSQRLQEQDKRHYWTNMNDEWGAKPWDVEPNCQIAGIASNDTVILDGAYGATVHWDSFQRVAITTRETWTRMLTRYLVRATPGWFFIGVFTVAFSRNNSSGLAAGAIFIILAGVLTLLSPMLILHLYSGKVWNSQPWLFGFEGHMDIRQIEMKIFGFPSKRLSLAPYSSSMSQHRLVPQPVVKDEYEGVDPREPLLGRPTQNQGENRISPTGETMRDFTIIDTHTM